MTDIAIDAPADAGAKPKKKKGKKKKLILLLLVVLLGAGGGYYAMYGLPGSHSAAAEDPHADDPQLVVREGVSSAAADRARIRASSRPPTSRSRAISPRTSGVATISSRSGSASPPSTTTM